MIISRAVLFATVIVASYAVLSAALSAIVAVLWKAGWLSWSGLPGRARADRLAALRLLPAFIAAMVSVFVVFPVFVALEPPHESEPVGPALIVAGLAGVALAVRAARTAARIIVTTSRIKRVWLQGATRLQIGVSGLDAFTIEAAQPIVALVGIWRPAVVAARVVVDACTESELASIVRHERMHLVAGDNLKRLLMACVPDVLALTPYHRAIAQAWHDAAEEAADDGATRGELGARLDLAALLLKVASLAPVVTRADATASALIDANGLERRVRRLVTDPSPSPARPSDCLAAVLLIGIALVSSTPLFSSATRSLVHGTVEAVVIAGAPGR
jgi:Zn-dependent protease with chaperone function